MLQKTQQYIRSVQLLRDQVTRFDTYPFCLPAFCNLYELEFHPRVTFIVGENGTGKSTLLEAVAVAWGFNAEGGTANFTFTTQASHSELNEYIRLVKGIKRPRDGFFLRAESFYNLATTIEKLDAEGGPGNRIITSYGGTSLHQMSHGESFFAVFQNRLGGNGLYILDEPEAALSPVRQMALISRIHELVQQKSQLIIATHSPIIMAYPDSMIIQLTQSGMQQLAYEQTENYLIMKEFTNNRNKMLKILLEE
ncbi:AAA family ATPase [Sporomusa sp.]|uniref:AAA family ATPase n=1 Tax=Sporomusa sp. TaxID=2078658 RepID=UPI002BE35B73|nr:AAA family ATPase [Sporomusa sp.]HWR08151.1 AAA family ATPase [Sporomusa sp.]